MNKAIIIASFGTTHEDTRVKSIERLEKQISDYFSDYHWERAFTSRIVAHRLKKNYNYIVNNEIQALDKLESMGYKRENVVIQPLHIIPALEYEKLTSLEGVTVSLPLMYDEKSVDALIDALDLKIGEDEAMVLFGHGSPHEKDNLYQLFQERLLAKGYRNVYVVTAEGDLEIHGIIPQLKKEGYRKVWLQPLMIVAGEHAKEDMASDEDDSLKSILEKEGFEVEAIMEGLGEFESVGNLFIKHLKEALQ